MSDYLNYIQQIGNALIEVHRHQLLHRDIRPGNIIIRSGKPETGTSPVIAIERKLENKPLIPPKSLNSTISDRTNNAILNAMELEASDRPQSVQDWLKQLGLSVPQGVKTSSIPSFSINWTVFWAGVAAIAAVLTALGVPQMVEKWLNQPTPKVSPSPSSSPKP